MIFTVLARNEFSAEELSHSRFCDRIEGSSRDDWADGEKISDAHALAFQTRAHRHFSPANMPKLHHGSTIFETRELSGDIFKTRIFL